jgi:hypothetical protein
MAYCGAAAAQSAVSERKPISFRTLLSDAGVTESQLAVFQRWQGKLSAEQASTLARITFRLEQVDKGDVRAASPSIDSQEVGDLIRIEGVAVSAVSLALPGATTTGLESADFRLTELQTVDGERMFVILPRIPRSWRELNSRQPMNEPVKLTGILLGSIQASGELRPLLLTNRVQWYPKAGVSKGVAWLVGQGLDAALLDDVRQRQPLAKPNESREGEAFYASLAAIESGDRADFMLQARDEVRAAAKRWKEIGAEAASAQAKLEAQLGAASPHQKKILEAELAAERRRQAMAQEVQERAQLGLTSVWPLFIESEENVGQFVHIEGTARRAVRIVASGRTAAAPTLREYYELDVFTTDSPRNQPIICCVTSLPAGFPTGEVIREPVRVAGVFFKRWAYARRPDPDSTDEEMLPERLAPPLILAAQPDWLRKSEPAGPDLAGLWGGLGFVGLLGAVWLVLARVSRRDRLARARRARYDAPLNNLVEP